MVAKNKGEKQRENVENRINTFLDFMKNLEKEYQLKKTGESILPVHYFVIEKRKGEITFRYYN